MKNPLYQTVTGYRYRHFPNGESEISYKLSVSAVGGSYMTKTRLQNYNSHLKFLELGIDLDFLQGQNIYDSDFASALEIGAQSRLIIKPDTPNRGLRVQGFRIVRNK